MAKALERDALEKIRLAYSDVESDLYFLCPMGSGAPKEAIDEAERALGCRFPPSYRLYLEEHNGGWLGGELLWLTGELQHPDLVWSALSGRKTRNEMNPYPRDSDIVISVHDEWDFFLDTTLPDYRGEYPVFVHDRGQYEYREFVAQSFLEFVESQFRVQRELNEQGD